MSRHTSFGVYRRMGENGQQELGLVYDRPNGSFEFLSLAEAVRRGRAGTGLLEQAGDDVLRGIVPFESFGDFNSPTAQADLRRRQQQERMAAAQYSALNFG